MSAISTWSTTAASNNSSPPDGAPEGMAPSTVNNIIREVMAQVRTWYEDAQWIDLGDSPTQVSSTTFTISGDVTATYHVGRRIKCTDSSTLYGTITASSYGAPNTTVNVTLDSGSLSGSLSAVAVGILSDDNHSLPKNAIAEAVFDVFYPVGAIYISTSSTNPGTSMGYGTWTQIARGRTLIGEGTSDQAFTAAATGGASTHTLTTDEMPAHTHTAPAYTSLYGDTEGIYEVVTGNGTTGSTGGGSAHNNLPPYLVVYIWERTA